MPSKKKARSQAKKAKRGAEAGLEIGKGPLSKLSKMG